MGFDPDYNDPHSYNRSVHYRIYRNKADEPVVICVQDFDYCDYDSDRFLSSLSWGNEQDAQAALEAGFDWGGPHRTFSALVQENLKAGDVAEVAFNAKTGAVRVRGKFF